MNSVSPGDLNSLYQFNPDQDPKLSAYSQFKVAAVSREQSADLTIVTKEGDKVTLSADSSFQAAYATYNSGAQINGIYTESRGILRAANVEREISISVEGDLNDEEKKEIDKVVREIFKMMKDFLSGRGDQFAVPDLKNIELETLANVEAKFEVQKTVLEASHLSARSETRTSNPGNDSVGESNPLDRLIGRLSESVKNSKLERDKFLNYFDRKPSTLTDEYLHRDPGARRMRKMVNRIFAGLFNQLENMYDAKSF